MAGLTMFVGCYVCCCCQASTPQSDTDPAAADGDVAMKRVSEAGAPPVALAPIYDEDSQDVATFPENVQPPDTLYPHPYNTAAVC